MKNGKNAKHSCSDCLYCVKPQLGEVDTHILFGRDWRETFLCKNPRLMTKIPQYTDWITGKISNSYFRYAKCVDYNRNGDCKYFFSKQTK